LRGLRLRWKGSAGGTPPRGSNDKARQAVQRKPQDGLVRTGAGQVDHYYLGFPLDHAGCDFEQPQAQRVERRHTLGRLRRQGTLECPLSKAPAWRPFASGRTSSASSHTSSTLRLNGRRAEWQVSCGFCGRPVDWPGREKAENRSPEAISLRTC